MPGYSRASDGSIQCIKYVNFLNNSITSSIFHSFHLKQKYRTDLVTDGLTNCYSQLKSMEISYRGLVGSPERALSPKLPYYYFF